MSQAKADQATDFLALWNALISAGVGSVPDGDRCGVLGTLRLSCVSTAHSATPSLSLPLIMQLLWRQ